jgi:hypothetical protein
MNLKLAVDGMLMGHPQIGSEKLFRSKGKTEEAKEFYNSGTLGLLKLRRVRLSYLSGPDTVKTGWIIRGLRVGELKYPRGDLSRRAEREPLGHG